MYVGIIPTAKYEDHDPIAKKKEQKHAKWTLKGAPANPLSHLSMRANNKISHGKASKRMRMFENKPIMTQYLTSMHVLE
jgi:hypothetical protein